MQRQSDMVLQQLESTVEVESSVEIHGPIVARKHGKIHAAELEGLGEGQATSRVLDTMNLLKEGLAGSRQRLAAADHRHVEQLRQIVALQQESRELVPSLYRHLSAARHTVNELLGKGSAFRIASIEGPTAQKREKLLRQAELAIARFEQPDLQWPASEYEGFTVDPQGVARGLKVKVTRLSGVLDEQRRLRREAQESRKVKNRTLEEHKKKFVWTARTLEGLYRLAGENELADRIRPSLRRRGLREVDVKAQEAAKAKAAEEKAAAMPADSEAAEATGAEAAESAVAESMAAGSTAAEESTDSTS